MKVEFTYQFEELAIDMDRLRKGLGYSEEPIPELFIDYLEKVKEDCRELTDICGAFRICEELQFADNKRSFFANGAEFKVGRTIAQKLRKADKMAFFVCTAGKTISEKASSLLKGEDPVFGYVYDIMGSAIAEAVADEVQHHIEQQMLPLGVKITNRYSPGYCHWNVSDQHKLFSLFDENPCGVSLTESALMNPVKSVSGVIGIGRDVDFQDYQCSLCAMKDCVYRSDE